MKHIAKRKAKYMCFGRQTWRTAAVGKIGSIVCADLHLLRMSITFCLTAQHILTPDAHLRLCFTLRFLLPQHLPWWEGTSCPTMIVVFQRNTQQKNSKKNVGRKADLEDSCSACNFPALHSEDGRLSWQPEACNVQAGSDKAPRVVAQVQNERITPTLLHSYKTHRLQVREAESAGLLTRLCGCNV